MRARLFAANGASNEQNGKLGRIAIAWVGIDDHLHSGSSVRLVFLCVDIRVER